MRTQLRAAVLIVAAFVGAATILSLTIIGAQKLTILDYEPADFLPPNTTLLLLVRPTIEERHYWSTYFPSIADLSTSQPEALAVLDLGSGTTAIAGFYWDDGTYDTIAGPYGVQVSSIYGKPLITAMEHSLRDLPTFEKLYKTLSSEKSFAIVKNTEEQSSDVLGRTIETLLKPQSSYYGVVHQENGLKIISSDNTTMPSLHALPSSISGALLSIRFNTLSLQSQNTHKKLSNNDLLIIESLLRTSVDTLLPGVSYAQHIPSILQHPLYVDLFSSGGTLQYVVEIQVQSTSQAHAIAQTAIETAKERLLSLLIRERNLDTTFASRNIRYNPDAIATTEEHLSAWRILSVQEHSDATPLILASKENHILISNSLERMKFAIQNQVSPTLLNSIATGYVDTLKLQEIAPSIQIPTLSYPFSEFTKSPLYWNIEKQKDIVILELYADAPL